MLSFQRSAGRQVLAVGVVLAGALLVVSLSACSRVSGLATTFNPCGTIFAFCDPADIPLLFADIPYFRVDPTCTIPGFGFNPDTAGNVPTTTSGGCADQFVFPIPGATP